MPRRTFDPSSFHLPMKEFDEDEKDVTKQDEATEPQNKDKSNVSPRLYVFLT